MKCERYKLVGLGVVLLLATVSAAAGTYYIDYVGGSDSNNGTAKTTPWKRAPGMKSFAGSYSHTAGDRFIFKGGVTWPVSCFQMLVTSGGSGTANQDYYGADQTWFSGGSWTRPVFDFQHTLVGSGWTLAAGVLVQADYVTFSDLDIANHRAPLGINGVSNWGSTAVCLNNANHFTLTNCIVRDWDNPTPIVAGASGGGAIMRVNNGVENTVVDCLFHQDNISATGKCGTGTWNIPYVIRTEMRNFPTGVMNAQVVRGCSFHDMPDPADAAAHSNVISLIGGCEVSGNLIHDISGRAQVIFTAPGYFGPGTDLVFNNVVYNVAQPCWAIDTDGQNDPGAISKGYNNTFIGPGGGGYCIRVGYRNNGPLNALDLKNNHLISDGTTILINNPNGGGANITHYTNQNTVTHTVSQATGFGYTSGNQYQPLDATKPTVGAGQNLSAYLTTDRLGTTRSVPWDVGAYEFAAAGGGSPGTLTFSSATYSAAEDAGSVVLTVKRTGGTSGIVGCSYASANGTASAGVNYTAVSSSLTWNSGDSTDRTITVPLIDANFDGAKDFTVALSSATGGAALGTPSTATVTITGSGAPPPADLPWPGTWLATEGVIGQPFASSGGWVSQATQTLDPAQGGSARYTFTLASDKQVKVKLTFTNMTDSANSLFIDFDSEPTLTGIWDVIDTSNGSHYASWRGTGAFDAPQFPLKTWNLASGSHTLIIRGREANCQFHDVTVEEIIADPAPTIISVSSTTANGYYKAGASIPIVVTFSDTATVTGNPTLSLNTGQSATYSSGSGTTNLTFAYTVGAGQTATKLDTASTSALNLNGGSIAHDEADADLTLPEPGAAGSLAYGQSIAIDTTAPTVEIQPSVITKTARGPIAWVVQYSDLNWSRSTLSTNDITLVATGTAAGVIGVSGPNPQSLTQTVTVSDITGLGTLKIQVASGTGLDLAGNACTAPEDSDVVTVEYRSVLYISNGRTSTLIAK